MKFTTLILLIFMSEELFASYPSRGKSGGKYPNVFNTAKGALLKLLQEKLWSPSLYQEVPCADGEIQYVDLDPSQPWRFSSPNYPSTKGYPHNTKCIWEFRVKPAKTESVSIICDHLHLIGNYFQDCENGDYFTIRHSSDFDEPDKLCGDLSDWIPMNTTIPVHLDGNSEQSIMAGFVSNRRNTATGFTCRIFAHERKESDTTEKPDTSTTTTTNKPGTCPDPDESYCKCGPVRDHFWDEEPKPDFFPIKIIGGENADPHQFPFQVGLTYFDYFFCGGSLITRKHVLTAAHCTDYMVQVGAGPDDFKVLISEHDFSDNNDCAYSIGVSRIIQHPQYNASALDFDYSILELEYQVPCSQYVSPVCLPAMNDDPVLYENRQAKAVGWGTVDTDTGEMADILQQVDVKTYSNSDCSYNEWGYLSENMICAGEEGKDSCQGDSGGPLLVEQDGRYVLAGVTSWGYGCGEYGYPGVYARVTAQLQWIMSSLGEEEIACDAGIGFRHC